MTRFTGVVSALLILAGTEIFVLAPYIIDIAVMIDVGGLVFVTAAIRASVSLTGMQLRELATTFARPFLAVSRTVERAVDFGFELSASAVFRELANRTCDDVRHNAGRH